MKIEVEESAHEAIKAMAQRLQDERDELLATLQDARNALQFANDTPNGPINDTIWMMHRPETLFDFMDVAIAKCTQEQPVSDWQERMK